MLAPMVIAVLVALPADEPHFDDAFWKQWGDGTAELAAYDLTFPRYGARRQGIAVTIFVTETFDRRAGVKAEVSRCCAGDEVPVIKLNLVRDFATGIYDYNTMASVFVSAGPETGRGTGKPLKASFSAQEWCGQVWHQLDFGRRPGTVLETLHSYFQGEADRSGELEEPASGVAGDALWHWARGWVLPRLPPGGTRQVPVLTSLMRARVGHTPLVWEPSTLSRSAESEAITVPAGTFASERDVVRGASGTLTFWVERAAPHRIIAWETNDGERAELLGSARLPYWKLNGVGGEAALAQLGLKPRPARTP